MAAQAAKSDIDTCRNCGKFFPRLYIALCTTCAGVEDNRFKLVREFLTDFQGASLNEVAEGTGLSRGEVARFYDQGRLVEVAPSWGVEQTFCTCVADGKRCGFCRQKLSRQLDEVARTPVENPRPAPVEGAPRRVSSWPGGVGQTRSDPGQKADENDGRVHYVRRARREGGGK